MRFFSNMVGSGRAGLCSFIIPAWCPPWRAPAEKPAQEPALGASSVQAPQPHSHSSPAVPRTVLQLDWKGPKEHPIRREQESQTPIVDPIVEDHCFLSPRGCNHADEMRKRRETEARGYAARQLPTRAPRLHGERNLHDVPRAALQLGWKSSQVSPSPCPPQTQAATQRGLWVLTWLWHRAILSRHPKLVPAAWACG